MFLKSSDEVRLTLRGLTALTVLTALTALGCGPSEPDAAANAGAAVPVAAPPAEPAAPAPAEPAAPAAPARDLVVELSARARTVCARFESGSVRCWGFGGQGEHGRGATQCASGTADVLGLDDALQLTSGNDYTCARTGEGGVYCWGSRYLYSYEGATEGDSEVGATRAQPVRQVRNVDSILLALTDTLCTLESDPATLRCRTGDPREFQSALRAPVTDAAALYALGRAFCVRGAGDALTCYRHGDGRLELTERLGRALHASGRSDQGCLVRPDGTAACANTRLNYTFAPVPGTRDLVEVAVGEDFACGRTRAGRVACWGAGALGNGSPDGRDHAELVADLSNVTSVVAGDHYACALTADGEVWCWGAINDGVHPYAEHAEPEALSRVPIDVPGLADVTSMASTETYSCAATRSGHVLCWGAVPTGPTRVITPTPTRIAGVEHVRAMSLHARHACFLSGEQVVCVGKSAPGELGVHPVAVPLESPDESGDGGTVARVPFLAAYGREFACFIRDDGRVECSGSNERGQLGRNLRRASRDTAVPVLSLTRIRAVTAGTDHVCALRTAGTVACWGDDTYGQLGQGTVLRTERPTRVDFSVPCVEAPIGPRPR